jgi:hypothetical protein
MIVGDRVHFTSLWSTFAGLAGYVTATTPHLMVLIDGDRLPVRVHAKEVAQMHPYRATADLFHDSDRP